MRRVSLGRYSPILPVKPSSEVPARSRSRTTEKRAQLNNTYCMRIQASCTQNTRTLRLSIPSDHRGSDPTARVRRGQCAPRNSIWRSSHWAKQHAFVTDDALGGSIIATQSPCVDGIWEREDVARHKTIIISGINPCRRGIVLFSST
jgi:hypothetical protein